MALMVTPAGMAIPTAHGNVAPSEPAERKARQPHDVAPVATQPPRLFIVCGRDRKVEELRELFARCGPIRHLHVATDRSNKSRGFAFLQYDEMACATEAIKQFDQMTLSDGHILKVTVARDKSSNANAAETTHKPQLPGKLKRNQHSQDDSDAKADDGSSTDGGMFPGKRQRSSPPSTLAVQALHQAWKRVSPFNDNPPRKPITSSTSTTADTSTTTASVSSKSIEDQVADVLGGIITQLERLHHHHPEDPTVSENSMEKPSLGSGTAATKRKAPTGATAFVTSKERNRNAPATRVSGSTLLDCEPLRPANQKSQRTTAAQATPNRHHHARPQAFQLRQRRHQSIDESDSSVDEASDASVGRRKRSNTTCTDTPQPRDSSSGRRPQSDTELCSRRRLSDLSELSLSPAGASSPTMTSKKRCSRRSSASSTSTSSSSIPLFHQTGAFHGHLAPLFIPPQPPLPRLPPHPVRRQRVTVRSKLFFTSTYKFTEQELEAMFSVYDEFEAVQLIKSFGRVKTMAYVLYATAAAASSVLSSFLEDNEGDAHGMMKLVFADSAAPSVPFSFPSASPAALPSSAGESTSSDPPLVAGPPQPRSDRTDGIAGDLGVVEARFAHLMSGASDQAAPQTAIDFHRADSVHGGDFERHSPGLTLVPGPMELDPFNGVNYQSSEPPVQSHGYFHFGQPYPYASPPPPPPHLPQPFPPHHHPTRGYYPLQPQPHQPPPPQPHPAWGYDGMYPLWPGMGNSPMQPDYGQYSWESAMAYSQNSDNSTPSSSPFPTESSSVVVTSSRPLALSALMSAIQSYSGVVGVTKTERDGNTFIVDLAEPRLAAEAATQLDGTMCNDQRLRVAIASGYHPSLPHQHHHHQHRAFPSRRKRQRLDQRGRRK